MKGNGDGDALLATGIKLPGDPFAMAAFINCNLMILYYDWFVHLDSAKN